MFWIGQEKRKQEAIKKFKEYYINSLEDINIQWAKDNIGDFTTTFKVCPQGITTSTGVRFDKLFNKPGGYYYIKEHYTGELSKKDLAELWEFTQWAKIEKARQVYEEHLKGLAPYGPPKGYSPYMFGVPSNQLNRLSRYRKAK